MEVHHPSSYRNECLVVLQGSTPMLPKEAFVVQSLGPQVYQSNQVPRAWCVPSLVRIAHAPQVGHQRWSVLGPPQACRADLG